MGFFVILGQSNRERIPNSSSNVWQKKHLAPDQLAQMEEQWSVDSSASGDREFSAGHVPERPARPKQIMIRAKFLIKGIAGLNNKYSLYYAGLKRPQYLII